MVKKVDEMVMEVREQMRGGKGSVEINHIFSKDETGGRSRLCAILRIKPGCSIGLHEHAKEAEIFHIIKGSGIIDDNGTKREVTAGDSILTGGGAFHSVENTGNEILEMFAIIIPD